MEKLFDTDINKGLFWYFKLTLIIFFFMLKFGDFFLKIIFYYKIKLKKYCRIFII